MSKKKIEQVRERDEALALTVAMRAYFSSYHLWAASRFAESAATLESAAGRLPRFDIEHRAVVTINVLSSVAFLEAAINELYQDAADRHMGYIAPLPSEAVRALAGAWAQGIDRLRMLQKYQIACHLTRAEPFDPGTEPFQLAALLVRLRNALVHYRPETRTAQDADSFERALASRFPENALMAGSKGNPYFPDKCLGAGCSS